ncbi:MAG: succinate dehydrogenase, hydrophobic membrane anchor protein [Roseiarcus sp.]
MKTSFRTAFGRVNTFGSARLGTTGAILQTVTGVALVPLTFGFVWVVLDIVSKDYNGVRAELGHPAPAIVLLLFVLAGAYHMENGMRSVIIDYLPGRLREWALIGNAVFAFVIGGACVYAALRIGFV